MLNSTKIGSAETSPVSCEAAFPVNLVNASVPDRAWSQQPASHPDGGFYVTSDPLDPTFRRGLRYRILMRDGFTCQYCGRRAPDVVLEVDHLVPRSRGGRTVPSNLVAACFDCNQGKKAIELTAELLARFTPAPVPPKI